VTLAHQTAAMLLAGSAGGIQFASFEVSYPAPVSAASAFDHPAVSSSPSPSAATSASQRSDQP
jgi:hypothetical protein